MQTARAVAEKAAVDALIFKCDLGWKDMKVRKSCAKCKNARDLIEKSTSIRVNRRCVARLSDAHDWRGVLASFIKPFVLNQVDSKSKLPQHGQDSSACASLIKSFVLNKVDSVDLTPQAFNWQKGCRIRTAPSHMDIFIREFIDYKTSLTTC